MPKFSRNSKDFCQLTNDLFCPDICKPTTIRCPKPTILEIPRICVNRRPIPVPCIDTGTITVPNVRIKCKSRYVDQPCIKIQDCQIPDICCNPSLPIPIPCLKPTPCDLPKYRVRPIPCKIVEPRCKTIEVDVPRLCLPEINPVKICCVPKTVEVTKMVRRQVPVCIPKPKPPCVEICPRVCLMPTDIGVPKIMPRTETLEIIQPILPEIRTPAPCLEEIEPCPPCYRWEC